MFLTRADQMAVIETIAAHLSPGGRFIFDSREPAAREWQEWTPELSRRTIVHAVLGEVAAWNDVRLDEATGVVAYDTFYEGAGGRFHARSEIAFPPRQALAAMIESAGLFADRWMGNWSGADWTPGAREIIPIGRLASGQP
ncbi:hypothetical protein [Mesorhizobium marinum]|uniref:hypothetical protein n=1 Tax=Mesorhizobium marinum TaxID=3228790 RepID=UPI003464F8F2